jgi:hypothetical protein
LRVKVNGPRDLPDFRMWLLDQWREPNGAFLPFESISGIESPVIRHELSDAALWWVEAPMCELVVKASRSMPETTLNSSLLIDNCGLAVFAQPLVGRPIDKSGPVLVHALLWGVGVHRDTELQVMTMCHYTYGSALAKSMGWPDWCPIGATSWAVGEDTEAYFSDEPENDRTAASNAEDRRWMAALHLLAAQPLAEAPVQHAPRPAAKRSARANLGSDVRVVNLRSRPKAERGDESGMGRTRREPDHRWIVGDATGGFWRQQAVGPNWSQHRPVFILPYPAGPEDKPLRLKETVKVLREDPKT